MQLQCSDHMRVVAVGACCSRTAARAVSPCSSSSRRGSRSRTAGVVVPADSTHVVVAHTALGEPQTS